MADPQAKLSVLVDPPLAEPPPVAELQRRATARRRRTVAGRGLLAAAAAVLAIGTGLALVPGDRPQTVQTAAAPSSTAPAASEPALATVAIKTFEVDGQQWQMLATRTAGPAICFTLRPAAGEEIRPGCLTPDGRALQAGAADLRGVSFLYGIVAPDVTLLTGTADGNASTLDVLGAGAGFPVRFVGTVIPPSVKAVELTASRNGRDERFPVPLPVHARISADNGREVPPAPPSTSATVPRPAQPSTTRAPDTPVSTVVPPAPPTTIAPGGGQPKRVQPVAGATDLRKQPFQSTAPAGAQSLAVRFWSGVEPCYVLGRVDVTETAQRVTITLWTGTGPGAAGMACIQIAGYYEVIVQLQTPLGDRAVVDGAA